MSETIIELGDGISGRTASCGAIVDMEIQPPSARPNAALPFHKLFGFADSVDIVFMILGAIGAVARGLCDPLAIILFGQLANEFGKGNITHVHANMHQVSLLCIRALYIGVAALFASFLEATCWMCTGERQAGRIRHLYLKAILRQDIGFFDIETSTGDVIGRMSGDIILIQAAIGEKVGNFTHLLSKFMGSFGVAFYMGWKLTVVMISATPLLVAVGSISFIVVSNLSIRGQQAYIEAGNVVEQTISTIRTVASFAGEKKAVLNYKKALVGAYQATLKQGLATGLGVGLTLLVTFCTYALALWYGSRLILAEGYSGRTVINVIFSVLVGGMSLAQAWPCLNAFAAGRAAASKMFQVIERKPEIDVYNTEGLLLADIEGDVELRDVYFNYPARPNVKIFSGLSLEIPRGTTVALVGENGSGKSTIINLIQRFYDPQRGEVLLDGHNIKQFQLRWMRQKLGLVSQEPVLFTTTIKQNIACGHEGATMAEIKAAAELANAAKFISKLPQGFDTMVGEHGSHLSGGQKQRIAIARAVLRNPKVLLLDEATSALDADSERAVQEALSKVTMNRTTIMITHRLTTIRSPDLVAVIQRGSVIEKGTHAQLIKDPCGVYSQLVRRQQLQGEEEHSSKTPFNELTNIHDNLKSVGSVGNKESVCEIYVSIGSTYRPISIHLMESPNVTEDIQWKEENESKSLCGLNNNSTNIGNEGNKSEFSIFRLASLNKPEVPIIVLGSTAAAVNGLISPVFGLLLAKVLHSFFQPVHKLQRSCDFWALMYVLLGVVSFIAASAQSYCFAIAGGRLVKRLRALMFEKVLHQEMGWFDEIQNFSGAIGARLSADAANVRGMVGDALSLAVQNIATIIAAIVIALMESWELSLLILALMPLIGVQVCLQVKFMKGFSAEMKIMYEAASQVAKDAVRGIRTVASFCAEDKVMDIYSKKCTVCLQNGIKKGILSGIVLGLSNLMVFGVYALIFWVGAHLINDGKTTFSKLFTVFFALTVSAIGVSQSVGLAPNISQLKLSTISVFRILDRKSKIDPGDPSGTLLTNVKGEIEFRHVRFSYPTRPNIEIFRDLCLSVPSGKTVGLVGESGCGKSTVISLMERFYDPDSGHVFLDGVELKTVQVTWLRHQMGLVSQEPVLFDDTIRSNICYGCGEDDNTTGAVSDRQIISASKASNAHDFISNLPQGYDTRVGQSGVLLSGGQKQRIAIARAILRDPKILLLDEATSALDAESERIVQHALDRVRINRTTIVISHKLSTIKNADIIVVVKNGVIAEQGRHDELITKIDGIYASLVKLHVAS